MKKSLFIAMVVSMGLMVGCGDSSSDSSTSPTNPITEEDNGTDVSDKAASVAAFFPTGYNANDVIAWYTTDVMTKGSYDDKSVDYVIAVYLFKDSTFIATENRWRDSVTIMTGIVDEGLWNFGYGKSSEKSDYGNITIETSLFFGVLRSLEIKNGKFTIDAYGSGEIFHFTLMKSKVPKASDAVSNRDEEEHRNGSKEQQEKAKLLVQESEDVAAKELTFKISEPEWGTDEDTYKATYTITLTWEDDSFEMYELETSLGICQFPVHTIGKQQDTLPEYWHNNDWDRLNMSLGERSITVTISQYIDDLKIARAYVMCTYRGKVFALYSPAFLIIPPGTELKD